MQKETKAIELIIYPTVLLLGVGLHYLLLVLGLNVYISTYLPIIFVASTITTLELKFPYIDKWKANRNDIINDASFMILVQILLPRLLAFFVLMTFLQFFSGNDLFISAWWPHTWPIVIQSLWMILIADFFRYWLHRASHEWVPFLWQLHAVHHSPKKLYWMNVGRFHPIEKFLQYIFDALPFIFLGVSEQVLSLYFLIYSINGFFQHCNIKLRLGWLNYVVSGPELHRWHHSKIINESNKNYGNNLIIWDIIFGTYFLPKNRKVAELGLLNRDYPLDFISQMKTPFIKGLDKR